MGSSIVVLHLAVPFRLSQTIDTQIGHDPMQPGGEGRLAAELGELCVDLYEGVLGHIPGLLFVLQNGERRAKRPRLMALVHHTDAEREWAYDRDSAVGRLDAAMDEAAERGWTLIDMRRDWRRVYPFDEPEPVAAPESR